MAARRAARAAPGAGARRRRLTGRLPGVPVPPEPRPSPALAHRPRFAAGVMGIQASSVALMPDSELLGLGVRVCVRVVSLE